MAQQPQSESPLPTSSYSDPIYDRLESVAQRLTRRLGLFLAALVVVVVVAAMARSFYAFAGAAARNGDATWILNIPTAPFWFVVDAMLWIGVVVQMLVTVQVMQGVSPATSHHDPH